MMFFDVLVVDVDFVLVEIVEGYFVSVEMEVEIVIVCILWLLMIWDVYDFWVGIYDWYLCKFIGCFYLVFVYLVVCDFLL